MAFEDHPTVKKVRARQKTPGLASMLSAQFIKDIALQCGADDAGIVELSRPSIAPQADNIRKVYGDTRALLSIACKMNQEPVRSPTRSVANEEFHGTYDHVNEVSRAIVRTLAAYGISSCNSVAAFPMEMDQPRIMMVQHKPIAVEAGLGKMGIHRSVIHPRMGSFVLLGTVLLGRDVDAYDRPLDYNPCLECKLCVAACPVGAIKPDGGFDFLSCYTHNYHDFLGNFSQWVEQLADAKDARDFRSNVAPNETLNVWQSLSYKPGYKAAYCISVCPAGEDVIGPFLEDRESHFGTVVKPLLDKDEILYVMPDSDAESTAKRRFPHKKRKIVGSGRPILSIQSYIFSLSLHFQRGKAKGLSLNAHLHFTGEADIRLTVRVLEQKLEVLPGRHEGIPDLEIVTDTVTWLGVVQHELDLQEAVRTERVRTNSEALLRDFMRCFPF